MRCWAALLVFASTGCYGALRTSWPDADFSTAGHGGIGGAGAGGSGGLGGSSVGGRDGVGGSSMGGMAGTGVGGSAGAGGTSGAGGSAGVSGAGGSAGASGAGGSVVASDAGDAMGDADAGCAETRGVIDFESLSHTGAFVALPRPYSDASGFTLDCTSSMSVVGSAAVQYLNTTAIITAASATVTLTRSDGKPFSLLKISLSTYNDNHSGVIYSFIGHKPDGSTANVDIPLLTLGRGFVPYTLPSSFQGLSSVEWTMNTADTAQYFDDISFAFCP
jgi:hypothetical protein